MVQLYLRGQNSFWKAMIYGWEDSGSEITLPANIQTFPRIHVIPFKYRTSSFMKLAEIQVSFELVVVLHVFVSLISKCSLLKLCLFYSPALKILPFSMPLQSVHLQYLLLCAFIPRLFFSLFPFCFGIDTSVPFQEFIAFGYFSKSLLISLWRKEVRWA